jgi:hypothetical protein
VQPGERVTLSAAPQVLMGGPYVLHIHPETELDLLLVANLRIGQELCFAAPGELPASALRHAPPIHARALGPGYCVSLDIRNISTAPISVRCTLEGVAPLPERSSPWEMPSDIPEHAPPPSYQGWGPGSGPIGVSCGGGGSACGGGGRASTGAPIFSAGGSGGSYPPMPQRNRYVQQLQARLRKVPCDGIYGAATHDAIVSLLDELEQKVAARDIELERARSAPETVPACDRCSREPALPSRDELRQRESDRNRYLDDPDGWSAWESATDES